MGSAVALSGAAIVPVQLSNTLAPNDDSSTGAVPLNIGGDGGINFFGQNFTHVYVNNNGNLTFSESLGTYTPNGLATGVGVPIIAPFFADVDTEVGGSPVMYGNAMVNGFNAFVVNYVNVAYFATNAQHNSFQVALIDRSDTGAGNFDIEFNYDQVLWETGEASGGTGGLGGTSAVVGYSNGLSGMNDVYFQLTGSLVNGALINGGPDALISHSLNSAVPGRYIFTVRNGMVSTNPTGPVAIAGTGTLGTFVQGSPVSGGLSVSGGTPPYTWSIIGTPPPGISVGGGGSITGVPSQPGNYSVALQVTDSAGVSASGTVSFSVFGLTANSLPGGIAFSPYSASIPVAGGTPPYSFTVSGLPAGLSANSSGGIYGVLTAPATFNVAVTATDGGGHSVSGTLAVAFVTPPPLSVPAATLPAGIKGTPYSQTVSALGGAPPYTWSLASGTVPAGMNFRSTGVISGLPSQTGTFSLGVRATDQTGAQAVGAVSLTIAPVPLTIVTPSPLASGMATIDYPQQMLAASGGVSPYTFAITSGSLPAGLAMDSTGTFSGTPTASGNFAITVTATDAVGSTGTDNLTFTIRPFSTDLILSTGSLAFSQIAGTTGLPPTQNIGVQSTALDASINYSVAVTPSGTNWLTVTPSAGTTPGALAVALNSQALLLSAAATPYKATISVTCLAPAPCAGSKQTATVNLTVVNASPQLSVLSDLLAFTASPGAAQGMSQSLGIQNSGGGSIGIGSVICAAAWCGITGVPGYLPAGPPVSLTVTADPTGLAAGYYLTTLTVNTSAGVAAIPVTLFIASAQSIVLQPAGQQFPATLNSLPVTGDTSFLVDVSGNAPVNWTATVLPGASWLNLKTTSGTSTATAPGEVDFSFDPGIVPTLAPRTYYATIRVTAPNVVDSPQDFQVVLNVRPAATPARPTPTPEGLLFITNPASAPPPQAVLIGPQTYQASTTTTDGGSWLSVAPDPKNPGQSLVSVNPASLQKGVYTGGVNYAFSPEAVRTVNVTVIVTGTAAAAHLLSQTTAPGCAPSRMVPAQMGLVSNFSAPAAWPTPLAIELVDDCGGPVNSGQIVATFSNGDPPLPLNLADPRSGLYSGTWTPRHSSSQVNINARATAPGFTAVTAQLVGAVTPNVAPLLGSHSTLHAYNPQPGAALAPGTLVRISGSGLAAGSATASATPLPASLDGTVVLIGGIPVPVSAVSPGLLSAQIPFELTPGMQYQVVVDANGALTTPDTIQLGATSPGVAIGAGGLLAANHLDGSAVSEASPAAPGENLVMTAAGLGLTDTPVGDGAAATSMPLANALDTPSLTIGGETTSISFAGLQPGTVGIYQINFTVPADAKNGDLTLILSQDGQPANSAILPVKSK